MDGGSPNIFDHPTSTSDKVYWPLSFCLMTRCFICNTGHWSRPLIHIDILLAVPNRSAFMLLYVFWSLFLLKYHKEKVVHYLPLWVFVFLFFFTNVRTLTSFCHWLKVKSKIAKLKSKKSVASNGFSDISVTKCMTLIECFHLPKHIDLHQTFPVADIIRGGKKIIFDIFTFKIW